jgi:hypothetical protein
MPTLAFPGADGFGKYTTGARRTGSRANPLSAEIILVTNLNDSGSGSLRSALSASGPKYIVPVVSGRIQGLSQLFLPSAFSNSTYLGQCSPGPLIWSQSQARIENINNAIIRGLIVQVGEALGPQNPSFDAFNGTQNTNMILDHCWGMWSIDENISMRNWQNSTMQWCVVSEALLNSIHDSAGPHSMGGIIYGANVSYHHNLYFHNRSRNPQLAIEPSPPTNHNGLLDFRNNLIKGYDLPVTGTCSPSNIINNYFEPWFRGVNTSNNSRFTHFTGDQQAGVQIHLSGNVHATNNALTANNQSGFYTSYNGGSTVLANPGDFRSTPYPVGDAYLFNHDAYTSKRLIEKFAGYRLYPEYHQDRLFNLLKKGPGELRGAQGVIDNERQVGGYSRPVQRTIDYDVDGISISWKNKYGLTVGQNVGNDYTLSPVYPNIEVYANSLVAGKWDINAAPVQLG